MKHTSIRDISRRRPLAAAIGATLALSGCITVGPDYHAPDNATVPSAYVNAVAGAPAAAGAVDVAVFWTGFHDEILNTLMQQAITANPDLRIAQARLQEARANLLGAEAASRPGVALAAGTNREVIGQTLFPGDRASRTKTIDTVDLPDARWEIDLFGKFARGREAAGALVAASEAGVQAAQVSLAGELASTYFTLRGTQQQLQIAEAALRNQQDNLTLVNSLEQLGRGTALDTARARALVASTQATLPGYQAAIARSAYRIAVLTGQPPKAAEALVAQPKPLPGLAPLANVGAPAQLLRQRPDIRVAERQLAAANAGIGVATAALFPSISLTGMLGLNAGSLATLPRNDAFIYNFGAALSWTPFDFGSLRSQIRANEARTNAALATYEKTVLVALEDVDDALVTYSRTQQQQDSLQRAVEASTEAARLAQARYEAGKTDFLSVLDAQRSLLSDQDRLSQSQTAAATSLVAVYKALGGGWSGVAKMADGR